LWLLVGVVAHRKEVAGVLAVVARVVFVLVQHP
jgi:hypothetical protein